jgi:hypothetical protein
VLETTRFAGDFVMRAELMLLSQRAIRRCQFMVCGRGRRRSFESRGVKSSGPGFMEGALLDGTVSHTMSTQRNWEKSLRRLGGHKVLEVLRTVGFKLGLHFLY